MHQAEKILVENVKHSDKESFKKLYLKYHPMLFRFVVSQVRDIDVAEDIVQETFIRVWKIRRSLNAQKSLFSLLAKISSNFGKDHFKHQAVQLRHQDQISKSQLHNIDKSGQSIEVEYLQNEVLQIVNQKLPLRQRTIFLLNRVEGKSNSEIAEILDLSQRTVENQIYRALKVVRKYLER